MPPLTAATAHAGRDALAFQATAPTADAAAALLTAHPEFPFYTTTHGATVVVGAIITFVFDRQARLLQALALLEWCTTTGTVVEWVQPEQRSLTLNGFYDAALAG